MKINILIATIDQGLEKITDIVLTEQKDVSYIVSHQVTAEKYRAVPQALKRPDVIISQLPGRGIARNRNNSLNLAGGDVALLADDDVRFKPENIAVIRETFHAGNGFDVACFKIATPAGEEEYKAYAARPFVLNETSGHYISSLEIAFRLEAVRKKGIQFDERFGLGSELIQYGEEAVFIYDCIQAGLVVKYVPRYVVEHPFMSMTKAMAEYAPAKNIFKGGYDARRYGWRAVPAAFYNTLRLRNELCRHNKSMSAYLRERLKGARYILGTPNDHPGIDKEFERS